MYERLRNIMLLSDDYFDILRMSLGPKSIPTSPSPKRLNSLALLTFMVGLLLYEVYYYSVDCNNWKELGELIQASPKDCVLFVTIYSNRSTTSK